MVCPDCGVEYTGRAKYCPKCTHEHRKAYLREYSKKDRREAIRVKREDYLFIKHFADDNDITIYEAVHILIHSSF